MRLLALLLLASCGSPGPATHCGVVVDGAHSVEAYDALEADAVDAYAVTPYAIDAFAGDVRAAVCAQWSGYRVKRVAPNGVDDAGVPYFIPWTAPGLHAAGLTDCDGKTIYLASDGLRGGLLLHELGHALDGCSTPTHEGWGPGGDRWFYPAIELAQAEFDDAGAGHVGPSS